MMEGPRGEGRRNGRAGGVVDVIWRWIDGGSGENHV